MSQMSPKVKMKNTTPTQTTIELPTDHPRPGTKHWVTQELSTPRPSTTRNVHLTTCPTCHAIILTGLNDDIAATRAQADPTTLNRTQATIHATAGRTLYHLTTTPVSYTHLTLPTNREV